jgi:hypothetical protein
MDSDGDGADQLESEPVQCYERHEHLSHPDKQDGGIIES